MMDGSFVMMWKPFTTWWCWVDVKPWMLGRYAVLLLTMLNAIKYDVLESSPVKVRSVVVKFPLVTADVNNVV